MELGNNIVRLKYIGELNETDLYLMTQMVDVQYVFMLLLHYFILNLQTHHQVMQRQILEIIMIRNQIRH